MCKWWGIFIKRYTTILLLCIQNENKCTWAKRTEGWPAIDEVGVALDWIDRKETSQANWSCQPFKYVIVRVCDCVSVCVCVCMWYACVCLSLSDAARDGHWKVKLVREARAYRPGCSLKPRLGRLYSTFRFCRSRLGATPPSVSTSNGHSGQRMRRSVVSSRPWSRAAGQLLSGSLSTWQSRRYKLFITVPSLTHSLSLLLVRQSIGWRAR